MKTNAQLNAATTAALAEVQAYRGAPLFLAFYNLLESIGDQHLETLAEAPPANVQRVQGALSQVRALRKAMLADGTHHSPIGV